MMVIKLLYAGFETCFGWDPQHQGPKVLGSDTKTHLNSRRSLQASLMCNFVISLQIWQ